MRIKVCLTLLLFTFALGAAFGQERLLGHERVIDSLKILLAQARHDTSRVLLLAELAANYQFFKKDTAIVLAHQAVALAQRIYFSKGEVQALTRLGGVYRNRGEYSQAIEAYGRALQLCQKTGQVEEKANTLSYMAVVYIELGEYRQGLSYLFQAKAIYERNAQHLHGFGLSNMGHAYERLGKLDSALYFQKQALASPTRQLGYFQSQTLQALISTRLGNIQNRLGNTREALSFYRKALHIASRSGDLLNRSRSQYQIAEVYHLLHQPDSSLPYAQRAFIDAQRLAQKTTLFSASNLLAQLYRTRNNLDSAFYYQQVAVAAKDSLFSPDKFRRLQVLTLSEQQRVQQLQQEQERSKARMQRASLLGIVGVFLLIALLLWRSNRQQQRTNQALSQKNQQIEKQRKSLEETLTELKTTQTQLIQKEKMASLGELTAGIAHEIQNPLNFVNNLSEVSTELVDELVEEAKSGHTEDVLEIAGDLRETLEKVNHHGKRADGIVKGMLQHSRASNGQKEPTDLNKLADEYLKLAYHGLRAKDKNFSADLQLLLDPNLSPVNVIQQDIGRVLLNLYNNALYAVQQKQKQTGNGYKPEIEVRTLTNNGKVELHVKDNGTGIPSEILNKIYQPFFTTKPTGEGTGLGLSLTYDIITKGHNGELSVQTEEGHYTKFTVSLPVNM